MILKMPRRVKTLIALAAVSMALANPAHAAELTDAELSAEARSPEAFDIGGSTEPISIEDAKDLTITILSDSGFLNASGDRIIDVIESDNAYLAVEVQDGDGRPVLGAKPGFSVRGTSQVVEPGVSTPLAATDESGIVEFGVIGGQMGMDVVTVTVGEAEAKFLINVVSHRALGYPQLADVNGGLNWAQLTGAQIRYEEAAVFAEFPEEVSSRSGEVVRMTGFMMPLDPNLKQSRFLLTGFPPSCFFHIPGGPAGVVEVFADEKDGGIEASYSPILIEGEFEAIGRSETGVLYRLHQARLVDPDSDPFPMQD